MKRTTITFDFEGSWGMPHDAGRYSITDTTLKLLKLLKKYDAKAVFFVTGKLVEENRGLIRTIHENGHEIGFHGYMHEHMHDLTPEQLRGLTEKLQSTASILERLIGYKPKGFRAPYLMGPKFYDHKVYSALAASGFTWVSNREIRRPEELSRPDRMPWTARLWNSKQMLNTALVLLNLKLVLTEKPDGKSGLNWLLGGQAPFVRPEGLIEYPLYSPLDCDLLGFPKPTDISGENFTGYATDVLTSCFDQSGEYFNLNCHDWITGTTDRINVLESTLAYIATTDDSVYYLPGLEGAQS